MSNFRGNDGNVQHWVLSELLAVARSHMIRLAFVDAHSMAPLAIQRTEKKANHRGKFGLILDNLPGQGSAYEQAWQGLSREHGAHRNSVST